jgi:hypothetical protein
VLLKTRQVGRATFTTVSVAEKARTPKGIVDPGYFSYYAGPVFG